MSRIEKKIRQGVELIKYALKYQRLKAVIRLAGHAAQDVDETLLDSLPIPPPHLVFLVGGNTGLSEHLRGGEMIAQGIRDVLTRNGLRINDFHAILDFGCGCGRIIRQWKSLVGVAIHGTDYNPEPINWCRRNLTFARFDINRLTPPMIYRDEYFDFIYAFSVFTHLPEQAQFLWIRELFRVLKPGGYLLITLHGEHYLKILTPPEQDAFQYGQLVVRYENAIGTNLCAVFHPERYVREKLLGNFVLVDFVPSTVDQDYYLLKKPLNAERAT